jgi:peptidyl-prolyl cis-trans isomerase B (cyclophilin B)
VAIWVGAIAAAVVVAVVLAIILSTSSSDETTTATDETTTATTSAGSRTSTSRTNTTATPTLPGPALPPFQPPADLGANCQYPASKARAAKQVDPPNSGKVPTEPAIVSASMTTDQGTIGLKLDNAKAPCTVNSFVSLSTKRYYDGTQCHRLTTATTLSVLQCGDPAGNGTGGPGYEFADEYPVNQYQPGDPALDQAVIYPRGTLAMANAGPNTNGSQFFIVYKDSKLPPSYTVFGTVDESGLAVVDKIVADGTTDGSEDGEPKSDVVITSVRID